jgi:hypothetical protein
MGHGCLDGEWREVQCCFSSDHPATHSEATTHREMAGTRRCWKGAQPALNPTAAPYGPPKWPIGRDLVIDHGWVWVSFDVLAVDWLEFLGRIKARRRLVERFVQHLICPLEVELLL